MSAGCALSIRSKLGKVKGQEGPAAIKEYVVLRPSDGLCSNQLIGQRGEHEIPICGGGLRTANPGDRIATETRPCHRSGTQASLVPR